MPKVLKIGWCFNNNQGSAIYSEPLSMSKLISQRNVLNSVNTCPAALDFNSRVFTILSPYSFRIRAIKNKDDNYDFFPVYPETEIMDGLIQKELTFQPKSLWRDEKYPILQLALPYVFFANERTFINQLEPNRFTSKKNWSLIQGRFDISSWQRPINWAIEWTDLKSDLFIKKGDPLCQIIFESDNPLRKVDLKYFEKDEYLDNAITRTVGVTHKLRGTRQLMNNNELYQLNYEKLNEKN